MAARAALTAAAPFLAPALLIAALALPADGTHIRHWGWVAAALMTWAALALARRSAPALRSPAALLILVAAAGAAWSAASIAWAQYSQHLAWQEANRAILVAAAVAIGCAVAPDTRRLARLALAIGSVIAALALTSAARLTLDPSAAGLQLFNGGRLSWPTGYANATAALSVTACLLLLGASMHPRLRPLARAATIGGAAACAAILVLAQSRASVVAIVIGLVTMVAISSQRWAVAGRILFVGVVVAAAAPTLADPYLAMESGASTVPAAADQLPAHATAAIRRAGAAVLAVAAVAAAVGAVLDPLGRSLAGHPRTASWARSTALATAGVLVGIAIGGAALERDALRDRVDGYRAELLAPPPPATRQTPTVSSDSSHFAAVGSSNRADFWRVAVDDARAHPLLGIGAGNFPGSYAQRGRSAEQPQAAHSLPLQAVGELGLVGACLLLVAAGVIAFAVIAVLRARPAEHAVVAGIVGALVGWAVHAGADILWHVPAATLPVALLAGGLASAASHQRSTAPGWRRGAHLPLAIACLLLTLGSLLAQTVADRAYDTARRASVTAASALADDPAVADAVLDNARRASSLDRTWAAPVMLEANVLAAARRPGATAATDAAVRREPRGWVVRQQAAQLLTRLGQPAAARRHMRAARQLNPRLRPPQRERR